MIVAMASLPWRSFGLVLVGLLAAGTAEESLSDGPYVRWHGRERPEVTTLCDGEVHRQPLQPGRPAPVTAPCDGEVVVSHVPGSREPGPVACDGVSRILAVSDVEGNHDAFVTLLRAAGVLDADDRWSFGDGHLVVAGDAVDRGEQVTEILWLLHRLEQEAPAAGGRVHYLLGNHETMLLAGDTRYVHPRYAAVAERLGVEVAELFGPDSEFGRWLRTRHAVVRIDELLFVHGGLPPALLEQDLSLEEIDALDPADETLQQLLWYRGYHARYAAASEPRPTDEELDAILERYGVETIVVGHCLVDTITAVYHDHRVLALDVPWRTPGRGEALLREDGALYRIDATGARTPLE
jgi:hypothetical protein